MPVVGISGSGPGIKVGDAYVSANQDRSTWKIGTKSVQMTFALESGKLCMISCKNKLTQPVREYVDSKSAADPLSSGKPLFSDRYVIDTVWSKTLSAGASADPTGDNVRLTVKKGDLIGFAVNKRDQSAVDWVTKVEYGDGDSYKSSDDTALDQGPVWYYYIHVANTGFLEQLSSLEGDAANKTRVPMGGSFYYPAWTKAPSVNGTTFYATDYGTVRVWKAPKDGSVGISGLAKPLGGGAVDIKILRITERERDSLSATKTDMQWRSEGVSARRVLLGGRLVAQLDWKLASLKDECLHVQFHIQAYPGTSILRHWVDIKNAGSKPMKPGFFPQIFSMSLRGDDADLFTHYWMVGGNNKDDQGMLQSADVTQSYHKRVGSHGQWTYAPWTAMERKNGEKDGWFTELDYMSNWAMSVDHENGGPVTVTANIPELQFSKDLQPGEQMSLPMTTFGVFRKDLDDMGQRIYDWQYTYLWDYTRSDWYSQMLYAEPIFSMNTGTASNQENFTARLGQNIYYADIARSIGFDILWDDAGWYAQAGWWNTNREGPDFAETIRYLAKSGMKWTLWFLSQPSSGMMDTKVGSWGNFQWRTDGVGIYSLNEDKTFRSSIEHFLDNHPRSSFHTCAGGGTYAHTFELQRFADANYFADFGGDQTNYYFSYMDTPDKWFDPLLSNMQDYGDKTRRMLSMVPMWSAGWLNGDDADLTPVTDLYRYLLQSGVAGKWSYTMHPVIKGDLEHQYCQRISYDSKKSIIILKHKPKGEVTIYPRGLLPNFNYLIEYEIDSKKQTRTGSDLMTNGIVVVDPKPGELIYLNLSNRPGSGKDSTPPAVPGCVIVRREMNMGHTGVGIYWSPGTDNNWVSGYEVRRGNQIIAKVGKGTYYFDRLDGWDIKAQYEVRTVDGDRNSSGWTRARVFASEPLEFSALGGHSSKSGWNGWRAESTNDGQSFAEMRWVPLGKLTPVWLDVAKQPGGAEGYWEAAGTTRVGHGWQQASTSAECIRTWIAPKSGTIRIVGRAIKDLFHQGKGGPLRVRILHNNAQVWPNSGWADVPQSGVDSAANSQPAKVAAGDTIAVPTLALQNDTQRASPQCATSGATHDVTLKVAAGDAVRFVLDKGTTPENDYIAWMPKIVYTESGDKFGKLNVVRILCGSKLSYTDKCGNVWTGDRFFVGGKSVKSKANVESALPTLEDAELYQSGRAGRDFTYSVPVKLGLYTLRLKFAETKHKLLSERPFNLYINGKQVLSNFDICQAAGGPGKALEKVFRYLVPDAAGRIVLRFTGGWEPMQKTDEAMVQAIEIVPELKPIIRIDAGSNAEFVDWSSSVWSKDTGFDGGRTITLDAPSSQASPTLYDQDIYKTARAGRSFSYRISAPPGLYCIHLKFAELWLKEPGKRPMNIDINGQRVREFWDPFKAAGEAGMAADFRVEDICPDKNGKIKIVVSAAGENDAILQGIEVE
ncbi:MAG: malectin domain-containing carbohydrate-binding protein [Armatimonadota bacterium]